MTGDPSRLTTTNRHTFRLNAWDQTAPRSYIPLVLCFDCIEEHHLSGPDEHSVATALEDALAILVRQRPDLAGVLTIDYSGREWVQWTDNDRIPYRVTQLLNDSDNNATGLDKLAGYSPNQLRRQGYPQKAFTGTHFAADGSLGTTAYAPVFKVEVFLFGCTLLMNLILHHGYADGDGMASVLKSFAEATRGVCSVCDPTKDLRIPLANGIIESSIKWDDFPEYQPVEDKSGPTQPVLLSQITTSVNDIPRIGKVFVIESSKMNRMRELVLQIIKSEEGIWKNTPDPTLRSEWQRLNLELKRAKAAMGPRPLDFISDYVMLAALTWAFVAKARLESEKYVAADVLSRHGDAILSNPVNWKARVPEYKALTESLFGNTTAKALTIISSDIVMAATYRPDCLALLVQSITQSIEDINADFVEKRTRLYESLSDPRELGLRWEPRLPTSLAFNTWRFIGGSKKQERQGWNLPGVGKDAQPAAYRKGTAGWGLGEALIMPSGEFVKRSGKQGSEYYELLVQLPAESMRKLCQSSYMDYVDRVIG